MQSVKLITAPLFISVRRLARGPELPQLPIVIADRLRTPRTIYHRITKRAAVRRANLPPVVEFLIPIVVTRSTRSKRAGLSTELRTLVFCVTINTTDPGSLVWLDHRRFKSFCVVTRSTSLLHVARHRMTGRA